MKRVLLISANTQKAPYPVPPLGVCRVAMSLPPSFEVRVYDVLGEGLDGLRAAVEDFDPAYIGIGIRNVDNATMDNPICFIDAVRQTITDPIREVTAAPIILGGSGFSIFPGEILEALSADCGIVGEGETAFPALLAAFDSGRDLASIPGVIVPGQKDAYRGCREFVDLTLQPAAAIDRWVDYTVYRPRSAYPIQTKRGCPSRCLYCSYPLLEGPKWRALSSQQVVDDIEEALQRLGDVTFEFVDATFNEPPGHAEDVCKEIIHRGLKLRLRTMGINPAHVTVELLDLMSAAGFRQIDCTPDTASPSMLTSLRKNFSLEHLQNAARHIQDHDMPTIWFFLFGGPGESEETVAETFDFIDQFISPKDIVNVASGLRIYPGTGLYQKAVEEGVIGQETRLLRPTFYVSPHLGRDRLAELLNRHTSERPNCIPAREFPPPVEMLAAAQQLQREEGGGEPMFRTLLRLRREMMAGKALMSGPARASAHCVPVGGE